MNFHAITKIKSIFLDVLLALMIFLFIAFIAMSSTIGNTSFYSRYVSDSAVTAYLQESIKEETDLIAQKNAVEAKAFDFAVGQNKISTVQKEIIKSAFSGMDYDYTDSYRIKQCYYDGISEYYRFNGMEIDDETLDIVSNEAAKCFNEALGIHNNIEFKRFSGFLRRTSIIFGIACAIFAAGLIYWIYTFCRGRTKLFGHYGCALISAGEALVLLFAANSVFGISKNLYFTDSAGLNFAISGAFNSYFLILALFGAAIIFAGIMLIVYVKKYYYRKYDKIEQELNINRTLYVASQEGDITVEDIFNSHKTQSEQENE